MCIDRIKECLGAIGMAVMELDGNFFVGADIAVKEDEEVNLYRIIVKSIIIREKI